MAHKKEKWEKHKKLEEVMVDTEPEVIGETTEDDIMALHKPKWEREFDKLMLIQPDKPVKGDMMFMTKKEALSGKVCSECRNFLKTHKIMRKSPSACIINEYKCRKCGLKFEVLLKNKTPTNYIVGIWKIL